MEDMVIPDVMNDVFLPQGRYPENFVLISQLEEGQEGGVKKGGSWRMLRVPDGTLGGQSHPLHHGWPMTSTYMLKNPQCPPSTFLLDTLPVEMS